MLRGQLVVELAEVDVRTRLEDEHDRQPARPAEVLEPPGLVLPDHVLRRDAEAGRARLVRGLAGPRRGRRTAAAAPAATSSPSTTSHGKLSQSLRGGVGRRPPVADARGDAGVDLFGCLGHARHPAKRRCAPRPAGVSVGCRRARRRAAVRSGDRRRQPPPLRQGARPLRAHRRAARGPAADGRQRPDLDLRLRPRHHDPRQGRAADPDVAVVVRAARRPGAATTSSRPTCPSRCAAARWSASGSRCTRSSAWPAATSPAPGCSTTAPPARSAASPLPEGLEDGSRLPGADLHAGHQGRRSASTTRTSPTTRSSQTVGAERADELRRLTLEVYARAEGIARERGIILADTKLEFGARGDGTDGARRRGAHAGLVAVLAGRRVAARPRAAVVRQADRAQLAALAGVRAGTARPASRRRRCRPRSSSAPGRATSRPTSCSPA